MKFRYFIQLSFAGTNYSGWQVQPNGISVQQVLNEKLSIKLNEEIKVTGAGRTDTGVHADYFFAHFDSKKKIDETCINSLNRFLPNDIVINNIFPVVSDAHARFSAISRTYEYRISRKKNPFINDLALYYSGKLDVSGMNEGAAILLKTMDFTSFSKLHTDNKTNICKVTKAEWSENNNMLIFKITADRFLRNMVRAITGTLLDIGKGKMSSMDFQKIIDIRNRQKAGSSLPAKGLFLVDIKYPEEIFL